MEEPIFFSRPGGCSHFLVSATGPRGDDTPQSSICEEYQDPARRLDRQRVSGCPEQGSGRPGEEDGHGMSIQGDGKSEVKGGMGYVTPRVCHES